MIRVPSSLRELSNKLARVHLLHAESTNIRASATAFRHALSQHWTTTNNENTAVTPGTHTHTHKFDMFALRGRVTKINTSLLFLAHTHQQCTVGKLLTPPSPAQPTHYLKSTTPTRPSVNLINCEDVGAMFGWHTKVAQPNTLMPNEFQF